MATHSMYVYSGVIKAPQHLTSDTSALPPVQCELHNRPGFYGSADGVEGAGVLPQAAAQ